MTPFFGALCVSIALVGLVVAVAGWAGLLPRLDVGTRELAADEVARRVLLGIVGFGLGWVFTGWIVGAAFVGAGFACLPVLLRSKQERKAALDKIEAIAAWAESLRDIMASGAGLRETLRVSARVAPEPIREDVRNLSFRLQHESIDVALGKFAADVAHPSADVIVASLLLATRWQAGGLPDVLTSVAASTRDAATMRQRVEGSRERTYTQSRIVAGTSIVFIGALIAFRREFLEPYDSFGGQIALGVICGMFGFASVAMYQLGRPRDPMRVFGRVERVGRRATAGASQR